MTGEPLQDDDPPDDAILIIGEDVAQPQSWEIANGRATAYTARCPDKLTANEDAAALIPFDGRSGVLAVADGVGGLPGGRHAAGEAMRALRRALLDARRHDLRLRTAILDAIEHANRAVLASGLGAAATLAVLEVEDGWVRPFHVGDCAILAFGQRGKLKLQTLAHSPVGFAVEAGLLDHEAAMHHEDRHLVSNVLGANDMRIEIGSWVALAQRDTVVLASDGLLDNMHVEEIVDTLRCGPLEAGVDALVQACRVRMTGSDGGQPCKPDDCTFVAFRPGVAAAPDLPVNLELFSPARDA